jgi:Zn-dependent protease with chaperone function
VAEPTPTPTPISTSTERARSAVFEVVSGTTLRFIALIAAVLGTAATAFSMLYTTIPANAERGMETYNRCLSLYGSHAPLRGLDNNSYVVANEQALRDWSRCLAPFQQRQALWVLAGLGMLAMVAIALYLVTPAWMRWRGALVPIMPGDFPELATELQRLVTVAGVRRAPVFLLDPGAAAPGGLAFGRWGRYAVRLNAGLVPLKVTDPPLFRAVVLHELAHLRNRDVDITYAAVALWRAFVAVALLPSAVALGWLMASTGPSTPLWATDGVAWLLQCVRLLVLVAVVYVTRNAVLRIRETYADVRAVGYAGAEGLRRAVAISAGASRSGWRGWLSVHPARRTRLLAIDDPDVVLAPRIGELFTAGVALAITGDNIAWSASFALPHTGTPAMRTVVWMVAPLVVGMLAAVTWRAEVLSRLRGTPASVVLPMVGFGVGWLLGDVVALSNFGVRWSLLSTGPGAVPLPFADAATTRTATASTVVLSALVLIGGMLCQGAASAAGARSWLQVLRGRSIRWAWAVGMAVTVVPFAAWYDVWYEQRGAPELMGRLHHVSVADAAGLGVALWPGPGLSAFSAIYPPVTVFSGRDLAIPAVALAWAYPLAAWLRPATGRSPRPPLALRSTLRVAAAGAGAFVVALLVGRALVHRFAGDLVVEPGFSTYFYYAEMALAVLVQALVGGVLAVRARPLGLVLGQFAASLVAVAATVAMPAAGVLGGCVAAFRFRSSSCVAHLDVGYMHGILTDLVVEGALAALLTGVWASVLRSVLTARRVAGVIRPGGVSLAVPARVAFVAVPVLAASWWAVAVVAAQPQPGLARALVAPSPTPVASPDAMPSSQYDPCVLGRWVETLHEEQTQLDQYGKFSLSGTGVVQTFQPDGTLIVDYGTGRGFAGTALGDRLEAVFEGTNTFGFHTVDGTISYDNPQSHTTFTWKVNGTAVYRSAGDVSASTDHYTCTADTLRLVADKTVIELRRIPDK